MRVGLNATCFNDRPSGAKQRFRGIYGALIQRRPDIEFILYEPEDCEVGRWFGDAPNVTRRRTRMRSTGRVRRAMHGAVSWPRLLQADRLDLFETFHLPLVRAPDCPTIVTVHDARPVLAEVPLLKRLLYGNVLRSALRKADHVVTVSETMRREILDIEPKAEVTTIYNGIDPAPFRSVPQFSLSETRERFALPDKFLLAVGHLERRKNYPLLIEAVAALGRQGQQLSLVIVGNEGGAGSEINALVTSLGLEEDVRILSGVTDTELAALYRLSTLAVFPSYYEGFGIPVLEAMAAGKPLLLSDTPVFRELTEDRGAYFPAHDVHALSTALSALLADAQQRTQLVAYGEQRVEDFAFAELAAQVEHVYAALV